MLGSNITEDVEEMLDRGDIPKLLALQVHNGTVYRWNRPCYGISDGKPHLRIENRVFSGGPTVADEIAKDRKSTRLNSSHVANTYAVLYLKKNNQLTHT